MGAFGGHINMGLGFLAIGLWHIFNHIRGHRSYPPLPWFPAPKVRHLELYLIMLASFAFTVSELHSVMRNHPLNKDGTIPFHHLHKVEHLTISLSWLTYAAFSIIFDKLAAVSSMISRARVFFDMTHLLAAVAFGLELFLFHFHSADHMGLEGHYHLLFQIVVTLSFTTTLIGIAQPGNFIVSFVRSVSILFQGVWTIIIGYMLWTPQFIPKGCWMELDNPEHNREYMVRCDSDHALHRAKSLATILFSFIVIGITVFSVLPFVAVPNIYEDTIKYRPCTLDVDGNDTKPKNKSSKSYDNVNGDERVHLAC